MSGLGKSGKESTSLSITVEPSWFSAFCWSYTLNASKGKLFAKIMALRLYYSCYFVLFFCIFIIMLYPHVQNRFGYSGFTMSLNQSVHLSVCPPVRFEGFRFCALKNRLKWEQETFYKGCPSTLAHGGAPLF